MEIPWILLMEGQKLIKINEITDLFDPLKHHDMLDDWKANTLSDSFPKYPITLSGVSNDWTIEVNIFLYKIN